MEDCEVQHHGNKNLNTKQMGSSLEESEVKASISIDTIVPSRNTSVRVKTPKERGDKVGQRNRSLSSSKLAEVYKKLQPVVHRTGWDIQGRVEDADDKPTRKLAGFKFKYRYPLPDDIRETKYFSGPVVVKQWSPSLSYLDWKRRWAIIRENKAFLLKKEMDLVATAIIKLDDCIVNPKEFGNLANSFSLIPPAGAINETNSGEELYWIIITESSDSKVEWMASFLAGAGWREKQAAESGRVPTITVCKPQTEDFNQGSSSCVSVGSDLSDVTTQSGESIQSRSHTADTIFPFPTPDIRLLHRKSSQDSSEIKLESGEGFKIMYASNARFFKTVRSVEAVKQSNKISGMIRDGIREIGSNSSSGSSRGSVASASASTDSAASTPSQSPSIDAPSAKESRAFTRRNTSPEPCLPDVRRSASVTKASAGGTCPEPVRRVSESALTLRRKGARK